VYIFTALEFARVCGGGIAASIGGAVRPAADVVASATRTSEGSVRFWGSSGGAAGAVAGLALCVATRTAPASERV